jgi:hypothetical protein
MSCTVIHFENLVGDESLDYCSFEEDDFEAVKKACAELGLICPDFIEDKFVYEVGDYCISWSYIEKSGFL